MDLTRQVRIGSRDHVHRVRWSRVILHLAFDRRARSRCSRRCCSVAAIGAQFAFPVLTLRMLDLFPAARGTAASAQSFVALLVHRVHARHRVAEGAAASRVDRLGLAGVHGARRALLVFVAALARTRPGARGMTAAAFAPAAASDSVHSVCMNRKLRITALAATLMLGVAALVHAATLVRRVARGILAAATRQPHARAFAHDFPQRVDTAASRGLHAEIAGPTRTARKPSFRSTSPPARVDSAFYLHRLGAPDACAPVRRAPRSFRHLRRLAEHAIDMLGLVVGGDQSMAPAGQHDDRHLPRRAGGCAPRPCGRRRRACRDR